MKTFEERKFTIPKLKGISEKTIEEHLKLYQGYVKNANSILEKIPEYMGYAAQDPFAPYAASELKRRFAFEFNGMRNHELYFAHFEGGPQGLDPESALTKALAAEWPIALEEWVTGFKQMAMTRGVGWAMLGYDKTSERLLAYWVDEQHLGQLNGVSPLLALDMWEHSFVADYQPSGKKQYVDDFFANLNWKTVEENFIKAQ